MTIAALGQNKHSFGCWFTHERRNWLALTMAVGLLGFAAGNGHTTQGAIEHVVAQAGCEHHRATVATKLALQPTMVDPKAIPKDNCDR